MKLVALPGVYAPRADTKLLLEALAAIQIRPGARVLELCTGTGAVALELAARGAAVTAVDSDLRAVASARLNAILRRLPVQVRRGDLFEPVAGQRFDLVVSNPPYLPCDPATARRAAAWDAGPAGRAVLERICAALPRLLLPGGRAVLVQSSLAGVHETLRALERADLRAGVRLTRRGPLGPIAAARADYLVRAGKLCATGGPYEEELVVIEARAGEQTVSRSRAAAPDPTFIGS